MRQHELQLRRFSIKTQIDVEISYKELVVGKHRLDIVVENLVVLELKACSAISDVHVAQALSYLKATGLELALVFNFGEPKLSWKRLIRSRLEV